MGQQQLLLLVLGIVIVGLAVVVGIQAFSENQKKANADAMVTDALRIASDCQAWDLKPDQFGGSLATETLAACTFDEIGFTNSGSPPTYTNVNGDYTLPTSLPGGCKTAPTIPSGSTSLIYVYGTNSQTLNHVCVGIGGTQADDVGTSITFGT